VGLLRVRRGPTTTSTALVALFAPLLGVAGVRSAEVPLEYQVKATYLFNFVKFVEWPAPAAPDSLTICVAERNPFGDSLREAIQGEKIGGRALATRVVSQPESACAVVFVPRGIAAGRYLEAFRNSSTLTVGEDTDFLARGGIIRFILESGSVRFEIDSAAAKRADLRISSHLLRLSRPTKGGT
jgi:YfiR/HmsC-like